MQCFFSVASVDIRSHIHPEFLNTLYKFDIGRGERMECQECHQNPATLHLQKIINGKKTEIHLCEQCAKEKGEMFAGPTGFSMSNLLSGLLNFDYPITEAKSNKSFNDIKELQCDQCGMTYQKFSKVGQFGCSNCYHAFNAKLEPLLKRVHSGNTTHAGKIPKRIGGHLHIRKEVSELRQKLQNSIQVEEFEKAAEFRDEIRSLEKKLSEHREGE